MPTDHADRRRVARWIPESTQPLSRVRLRLGRELTVIDASPFGLLVEGAARLLPGTHVDVHVTAGQGRALVRARVTRCVVSRLTSETVCYRGALAFDVRVDIEAPLQPIAALDQS